MSPYPEIRKLMDDLEKMALRAFDLRLYTAGLFIEQAAENLRGQLSGQQDILSINNGEDDSDPEQRNV